MASGAAATFWQQVIADGMAVPEERSLGDMTVELTTMLGSPDPELRDGIAYPTLATWIQRGVYDDLLTGLGDGMVAGLENGLGAREDDTVFRRSFSVLILGECLARDNAAHLLPAARILEWGDRLLAWYLREQDIRGWVRGKGWAHAVAHGADAIAALAESEHLGKPELTVMLDVLADRLLLPSDLLLTHGEPDRMATATMSILRRDLVPLSVVEPWIRRITHAAESALKDSGDPFQSTHDPEAFLRALHLQVALAPHPPAYRSDLLLILVDALRTTNPDRLAPPNR